MLGGIARVLKSAGLLNLKKGGKANLKKTGFSGQLFVPDLGD